VTANEEFREMLKRSGWNQAEASRQLELTTADVSRYVNNVHPPDKQTLRLFRLMLAGNEPSSSSASHAAPAPYSADIKTRAKKLQQRIKSLMVEMEELLDGEPASKKTNSTVMAALDSYAQPKKPKASSPRQPSKKLSIEKHPAPSGRA
jgi:hypothetical protein